MLSTQNVGVIVVEKPSRPLSTRQARRTNIGDAKRRLNLLEVIGAHRQPKNLPPWPCFEPLSALTSSCHEQGAHRGRPRKSNPADGAPLLAKGAVVLEIPQVRQILARHCKPSKISVLDQIPPFALQHKGTACRISGSCNL